LGLKPRQRHLPHPTRGWTLTTLREKLIKIGALFRRPLLYLLLSLRR
jgi:hypothetical protein